jgi:hypothetical protein
MLLAKLELEIDLQQWQDMGFEVKADEEIDFAKEEFVDWIRSMKDYEILECIRIEEIH